VIVAWRGRHRNTLAHAALLTVLVVVLVNPWAVLRGGVNSGADLAQRSLLYRIDAQAPRANPLLSDTERALSPWLEESRRELLDLRFPVWNRYEGNGAPQLGNAQTAVLSPFSVPIDVLGFRWGSLIADIAKIVVGYLGVLALVRALGGRFVAQAIAASTFVLSGYFVVWLYWPLPSEMSLLPVAMLAFLATYSSARRQLLTQAGVICAIALAGHPETAAFSGVLVAAFVLIVHGETGIRAVVCCLRNMLIGLSLAAVQIVPFLNYLRQSEVFNVPTSAGRSIVLQPSFILSALTANGLGRPPGTLASSIEFTTQPNFNELLGSYVSPVAVLLAVIGIVGLFASRRRVERDGDVVPADVGGDRRAMRIRMLMSAVIVLWLPIWFNPWGIGTFVIRHMPANVALNRAHPVFIVAVCVLAAYGVEDVVRHADTIGRWWRAGAGALVAVVLGAALVAYPWYVHTHNHGVRIAGSWTAMIVPVCCCATAAATLLVLLRGTSRVNQRALAWAIVTACVVVAPVYGFWRVNSVIDTSFYFPRTPALATVRAVAGPRGIVLANSNAATEANVLSIDKVTTPFLYDAINLYGHFELVQALGGRREASSTFNITDVDSLSLFGINEVVRGITDKWDTPFDTAFTTVEIRRGIACATGDRTCVASVDGRSSMIVDAQTGVRTNEPDVNEAAATNAIRPTVLTYPRGLTLATFDDRLAYFRVDATSPATLSTGCESQPRVPDAVAYVRDDPSRAMITPSIDGTCAADSFPAAAVPLSRSDTANRWGGNDYAIAGGDGRAGVVWVAESDYSSWRAQVDGHDAPVVRVNGAFIGVQVPPGWHDVQFHFVPRDVEVAMLVTLVTIIGIGLYWMIDRRRTAPPPPPG